MCDNASSSLHVHVLTIKEVAMSNRDTILIPLPTTGTWMASMATRRTTASTGLPPARHLGTHQLGRGLGTSAPTDGLLGTAAAGRGPGRGGGSWNVLLPLADLHCRGLSLLMLWNGWKMKVVRRLSLSLSLSLGEGRPNSVGRWYGVVFDSIRFDSIHSFCRKRHTLPCHTALPDNTCYTLHVAMYVLNEGWRYRYRAPRAVRACGATPTRT
jgi:hypothetical protein